MSRARIVPGLILMSLGGLFLLDNLDVLDAGATLARWWPLVFVAIGAARLLSRPPDVLGGAVTAGIGIFLLGVTNGALGWSVLTYLWPAALILVGSWLLVDRRPPASHDEDEVTALTFLSGRQLASSSPRFAGGSIVAILGGIELDLRSASPVEGARLDVTALFGGCDITVPAGWRVRMSGPAILGGYEDHTVGAVLPDDAPVLQIRVLAVFGGVDVKAAAALPAPAATWKD